jgi:cephalosporin hydroxylase
MRKDMNPIEQFELEKLNRIKKYQEQSLKIKETAMQFNIDSCFEGYTYNFSWMGRPIIQFPQDMIAMQELIWEIKPDVIIETGIAHGGSLVFYASILELLGKGKIVGVDVEIREHNRQAIETHPMAGRIEMIEGSSISVDTVVKVAKKVKSDDVVMVCLDSKHTHDHVLEELRAYSGFVTPGSYLVVFDTTAESFPDEVVEKLGQDYRFKPWGKGSNPSSALHEYLGENDKFEIDSRIHNKLMITNCVDGFLRRK